MAELWQRSASEIAKAVKSGAVSAVEVTGAHLARLAAVNPAINAVVQEFPDEALASARDIDAAIARGADPGPLAGVPVTVKVNVDQVGHATTNGLRMQADLIATRDNPVVANLRGAGAVIVGRTNTPAFSLRWFTDNSLHGQTLNPRDAALTPGGSSGGTGAAVAAGISPLGHGTDIAGSIRYPAYACGLHGLRPTPGRIPAWNPSGPDRMLGAQMMAVSGPIARAMEDIELGLRAMMAGDAGDPGWIPAPLDQGDFPRRAALCAAPDDMIVAPEVTAALERAAGALRARGWQVGEAECPPIAAAAELNELFWMADTLQGAQRAIYDEGDAHAVFVFEQMTRDLPDPDLAMVMAGMQARAGLIRDWQMFLGDTPLVLMPSSGAPPFAQQLDVRSPGDFARVYAAQLTQRAIPTLGLPGLSVATDAAAPMGVQLVAGRFREDILIAAGRDIEAELGAPQACDPG